MTPPLKPDTCIANGRIGVFIGADYAFLSLAQATALVKRLQGHCASLRGTGKRIQRQAHKPKVIA